MSQSPFFIQKHSWFSGTRLSWLLLVGVCFALCFSMSVYAEEQPKGETLHAQLKTIDVSGNMVSITASSPIKHAVVPTADPFKVLINLENIAAGSFKAPLRPDKSIVSEITVLQADVTKASSQIVFSLAGPAQMKIEEKGASLEIVFEETAQMKAAPALDGTKASASSEAAGVSAREITDVLLEKTEQGAELVIKTDNRVKDPAVYEVEGSLYIDVPVSVMKAKIPSKMVPPVRGMKYRAEQDRVRFIIEPTVAVEAQVTILDDELVVDIKPATAITRKTVRGEEVQQISPEVKKKTVSLDFQDADIVPILRLLGDVSGYNMVVHPDVKGRITMKLVNAPWDQALDIVLKTFTLEKIVEGTVIRIVTGGAYQAEKKAIADAREIVGRAEEVTTKLFVVNNANLDKIREAVEKGKILSPRGSMSTDARTRSMIVKDIPSALEEVGKLVGFLDKPTPQVLIDARLVEVSTNFSRELGIEWSSAWLDSAKQGYIKGSQAPSGIIGGFTNAADEVVYRTVNLPTTATPAGAISFGIARAFWALEARISAIEAAGKGKTISNPKILTVDNEQAVIKHGAQIPVTTRTQDGTFSTQYKDANLKLTVTPQISPDGTVYMKLEITKDEPDFSRTDALGNPTINSRQATTQLYVKDGETVVIGGIIKTKESDNEKSVPGLSKIPLLGLLFKNSAVANESEELLIFITPRIVRR